MTGRAKAMFSRIRGWKHPSTADHPPAAVAPKQRRSVRDALLDTFGKDAFDKVNSPSTRMSVALAHKNGPTYAGTVAKATIARRRAANKRARVARSLHRRAAR